LGSLGDLARCRLVRRCIAAHQCFFFDAERLIGSGSSCTRAWMSAASQRQNHSTYLMHRRAISPVHTVLSCNTVPGYALLPSNLQQRFGRAATLRQTCRYRLGPVLRVERMTFVVPVRLAVTCQSVGSHDCRSSQGRFVAIPSVPECGGRRIPNNRANNTEHATCSIRKQSRGIDSDVIRREMEAPSLQSEQGGTGIRFLSPFSLRQPYF